MNGWRFAYSFMLLILCSLAFAAPAWAAPRLSFERELFTFPETEAGTRVSADFPVRNAGDAPLEITEVRATCDCTQAFADPKTLKPGQSGAIIVELDTSYRLGDLDKEVIVRSTDPARPEVTLHVKGKTWQPLTLRPSPLFFDQLTPGKEALADVVLTNTGKKPIAIKQVLASEGDVALAVSGKGGAAVTLPYTLQPEEYLWVRVTLQADPGEKDTIYRQIAVAADPPPATAVVLKIQAGYKKDQKK
jgi:hypothetical protein